MPAFHSMTSADVVVVGGGTVGGWTAVQLAERGVKRVVLIEKSTLGDGAKSAGGRPQPARQILAEVVSARADR